MTSISYETPSLPPQLPFADQRGGMKVMGVVLIVIGAFLGCLGAFTPLALVMPMPPGTAAPMARDMLVGAAMYLLAAGVLITAGAGSLRIKRWSRPIVLIVTGTWALYGLMLLVTLIFIGPDLERAMASMGSTPGGPGPAMPANVARTVGIVTLVVMLVFMVLLPSGFFWFYVRSSVRQTADYFDPIDVWTDSCPLPVLALSCWLGMASLFALSFCLWGVFPLFGRLISGMPAVLLLAGISLLLAALAVGVFRLNRLAWLVTAVVVVMFVTSSLVTFSRIDPIELYRLSGTPPEQIKMMELMNVSSRSSIMVGNGVLAAAALGYLAWVWRYFRRRGSPDIGGAPTPTPSHL